MEVPQAVRELFEAWSEARDAADADRLASLYAADAILYPPGGQPVQGRAAIAAHFKGMLPLKERNTPRFAPARFYFFPPLVHAIAAATGRHGEKHSIVDILAQQPDGSYLFVCSSWTYRQA